MTLNLLLEAVDVSSAESLYKAIERGQVPGVSLKKILSDEADGAKSSEEVKKDYIKRSLTSLINTVKRDVPENRKNLISPIILLILKKANNKMKMISNINDNYYTVDAYLAYFLNKDKQEAKTTHKKLFDNFANSKIDKKEDWKFEQEVNKLFAKTKTIKDYDKEVEVIYPEDKDGWEVLSPKTFAASSKLACMKNRKAKWCTAARNDMFSSYSNNGNKLFIIKNEKLDKMFQMDFGEKGEWYGYRPNFMDENDRSVSTSIFLKNDLPEELLKSIKNKKGISLYEKLKPLLEKLEKAKVEVNKTKEELKSKLLTKEETKKDLKIITIPTIDNLKEKYPEIFKNGLNITKDITKKEDPDFLEKADGLITNVMSGYNRNYNLKVKKINTEKIKKDIYVIIKNNEKFVFFDNIPSSYLVGKKRVRTFFSLYSFDENGIIKHYDVNEIPAGIKKLVNKKGTVQKVEFSEKIDKENNSGEIGTLKNDIIYDNDSYGSVVMLKINNMKSLLLYFDKYTFLDKKKVKEKVQYNKNFRNFIHKIQFPLFIFNFRGDTFFIKKNNVDNIYKTSYGYDLKKIDFDTFLDNINILSDKVEEEVYNVIKKEIPDLFLKLKTENSSITRDFVSINKNIFDKTKAIVDYKRKFLNTKKKVLGKIEKVENEDENKKFVVIEINEVEKLKKYFNIGFITNIKERKAIENKYDIIINTTNLKKINDTRFLVIEGKYLSYHGSSYDNAVYIVPRKKYIGMWQFYSKDNNRIFNFTNFRKVSRLSDKENMELSKLLRGLN